MDKDTHPFAESGIPRKEPIEHGFVREIQSHGKKTSQTILPKEKTPKSS